jgi:hypothetical protein
MEAIRSSETAVQTTATRCYIPEDNILFNYFSLKSWQNYVSDSWSFNTIPHNFQRRYNNAVLIYLFICHLFFYSSVSLLRYGSLDVADVKVSCTILRYSGICLERTEEDHEKILLTLIDLLNRDYNLGLRRRCTTHCTSWKNNMRSTLNFRVSFSEISHSKHVC